MSFTFTGMERFVSSNVARSRSLRVSFDVTDELWRAVEAEARQLAHQEVVAALDATPRAADECKAVAGRIGEARRSLRGLERARAAARDELEAALGATPDAETLAALPGLRSAAEAAAAKLAQAKAGLAELHGRLTLEREKAVRQFAEDVGLAKEAAREGLRRSESDCWRQWIAAALAGPAGELLRRALLAAEAEVAVDKARLDPPDLPDVPAPAELQPPPAPATLWAGLSVPPAR